MSSRDQAKEESSSGSALDALLLAEREAATRLARAQADAEALIKAATAKAEQWTQDDRAAFDAELALLDANHVAALREMEREVAESAAHTVTRYRTITDEVVTRLAAIVLTEVAGLPSTSGQAVP